MKTLISLIIFVGTLLPGFSQVVSNVNWELEGNERIVITYDLAKEDTYIYFDVSVKATIDKRTINPTAVSGDVGTFIKVGTGKKIIWNIFQDITELNGELSVEVLAFNPVPATTPSAKTDKPKGEPDINKLPAQNNIPFWVGMGSIGATGIGFLMKGAKSKSEGQDLYKIYKENRIENAEIYTTLETSRNDLYDEANKNHKTGTFFIIAGSAVLVTAGVIMVNRILQMKKLKQRGISFEPHFNIDPASEYGSLKTNTGLTIRCRL